MTKIKNINDIANNNFYGNPGRTFAPLDNITKMVAASSSPCEFKTAMDAVKRLDEISAKIQEKRDEKTADRHHKKEVQENIPRKEKPKTQEFKLYDYRKISRGLLPGHRHCICGTRLQRRGESAELWETKSESIVYKNLMQCGSVWVCPVCRFKLMSYKENEIMLVMKYAENQGYFMAFLTLTVSHGRYTNFDALVKRMSHVLGKMQNNRKLRKHKFGFVRALEFMYGGNGFHPHFHIVLLSQVSHDELKEIAGIITKTWLKAFQGATKKNQKYEPVYNSTEAIEKLSEYTTKCQVKKELTNKTGAKRGIGHISPLSIPRMIFENQLEGYSLEDLTGIYVDYARISKGKNSVSGNKTWNELKRQAYAVFMLEEKTEDEILQDTENMLHLVLRVEHNVFTELVKLGLELELQKDVARIWKESKPYKELINIYEVKLNKLLMIEGITLKFTK